MGDGDFMERTRPPTFSPSTIEGCPNRSELPWPRCAELSIDVILDVNFWSRRERDDTRARAAAVGANSRLYRLGCSADEAWRRIEKRNHDLRGALFIARETFELLKERFEPLDADEARIEVANSLG